MAAHDTSSHTHLFELGIPPEELAHQFENFPIESKLTPTQLAEYFDTRQRVKDWLKKSAEQYERIWDGHVAKNPELHSVTASNFDTKRSQLAGTVPEYVWDSLEKSTEFTGRLQNLNSMGVPKASIDRNHPESTHPEVFDLYDYALNEQKKETPKNQAEAEETTKTTETTEVTEDSTASETKELEVYTDEQGNPSIEKDPDFITLQQEALQATPATPTSASLPPAATDNDATRREEFDRETSALQRLERQRQEDFQQQEAIYNTKMREIDEDEAVDNRARKSLDNERAELLDSKEGLDRQLRAQVAAGKISVEQAEAVRATGMQKIKQKEDDLNQAYRRLERRASERDEKRRLIRKPDKRSEEERQRLWRQKHRERIEKEEERRARSTSTASLQDASLQHSTEKERRPPERKELLRMFLLKHPDKLLLVEIYAKDDPLLQQVVNELKAEAARRHAQQVVQLHKEPATTQAAQPTQIQPLTEIIETVAVPSVTSVIVETTTTSPSIRNQTPIPPISTPPPAVSGGAPSPQPNRRSPVQRAKQLQNMANRARKIGMVASKAAPLLANPIFWIVIGTILAIVLIITIVVVIFSGSSGGGSHGGQEIPVDISKTGPDHIANGQNIPYTITVSYAGTATDIVVTDPIPTNATFVSATGKYQCDGKPPAANQPCKSVSWNASQQNGSSPSNNLSPSPSPATSGFTFDEKKFAGYGFPPPQNPNPVKLDPTGLKLWKQYDMAAAIKASKLTGVDVGIIGFWSFAEDVNYAMDVNTCGPHNTAVGINGQCADDNWQGGNFAVQPGQQVGNLQAAFDAMYGSHDDATVQRVGQAVLNSVYQRTGTKVTYPATTFPKISLETIVNNIHDPATRAWEGDLMDDDAIGAYVLALVFKGSIGPGLADSPVYGYHDPQKVINYIKAVYDAGIDGSGGSSFPPQTYTLTLKPTTNDSYVINQASAEVLGGSGGISTTGVTSTGQCADPTDGVWPAINHWDPQVNQAISTIQGVEQVSVPCNLVKAFMSIESQGVEAPPNVSGYMGLMQVGDGSADGGGSDCDWKTYDVHTTQGNLNCGVQEIARGLKACNNQVDQAIGKYFTGTCDYKSRGPDAFGTTPTDYVNNVMKNYDYLNSYGK